MKKRRRRRKQHIYYATLITVSLIAVVIIVLIGKHVAQSQKDTKQVVDMDVLQANANQNEDTTGNKSEETTQIETEAVALESIAVDIGQMDDTDDPQAAEANDGEGIGATVTMDDVVSATASYETSGLTLGIDVSKYQGTIDWSKVASSGVQFAMIRVGYRTQLTGVICEDPCAKYNMQEAQKNGIKIGAYFFSTAVTKEEALEEASWVSGFIAKYKITYPVAFNCEGFQESTSRQYQMTIEDRTSMAVTFLDTIASQGYTPMFYASKGEMEQSTCWNMDTLSSKYKVWVSQYPELPYPQTSSSSYSGTHDMWQYTSQGNISGISSGADMNVAYFGYEQEAEAKDTTGTEEVSADPEVNIIFTEVNETVTAKSVTNLRSVPSSNDDTTIVATLNNGDTATRTGVGNNGWSRIIYNNQKLYAVSSYLTTDMSYTAPKQATETSQAVDQTYSSVNETVTAKSVTNLRTQPSTDSTSTVVTSISYGTAVTRTGIGSNGWSKIDYNGQTVYAVSSYLTTDFDYQQTAIPTTDNPEAATTFRQVSEQVTPKIETNLRTVPSTDSDDTIALKIVNGDIATRTGIADNGWSRVEYNGQTLYAVSNYLVVVP